MGQLRIYTIARVLSSPKCQEDEIVQQYNAKKTEKLKAKHKDTSTEDLFQKSKIKARTLSQNIVIAKGIRWKKYNIEIKDRSPFGAANTTEDINRILRTGMRFADAKTHEEQVAVFEKLVNIIVMNNEPILNEVLGIALERIYNKTRKELRHSAVSLPLAIAIGLQFSGLPTERSHRHAVRRFIDSNFPQQLKELCGLINAELNPEHRRQTAELLKAARRVRNVSYKGQWGPRFLAKVVRHC